MADISEYLETLRTAIYGEDMRLAIIGAITLLKGYGENYEGLSTKISELETNFSLNKEEVGGELENLLTVITNLSNEINNTGKLFITGKNLFDKTKIQVNKGIDSLGNIVNANTEGNSFDLTDWIPIKRGQTLYFSYNNGTALSLLYGLYDSNKTFIERKSAYSVTAEQDGYILIRLNHNSSTIDTLQVELDGVTDYEEFYYKVERYEPLFENVKQIEEELSKAKTKINDLESYASFAMFENFAVVGDSYASGEIYKQSDTGSYTASDGTRYDVKDYYNLSWGQIIARLCGVKCTNLSVGGLSTRTWLTNKNGLEKMLATEPQNLYILALGINDVGKEKLEYFGDVEDIDSDINDTDYTQNRDTFYGNYGKIIAQIKEHAPNSKLIISCCAKNNTEKYRLCNTEIEKIAQHYHIPCIKQYEDDFFKSEYYLNNMVNGHPTAPVYSGMATAIMRLVNKAIQDNLDYFMDYVTEV